MQQNLIVQMQCCKSFWMQIKLINCMSECMFELPRIVP